MKKLLMFALVATFAFGATALVATDADARAKGQGILGSAHDFTNDRGMNATATITNPDYDPEVVGSEPTIPNPAFGLVEWNGTGEIGTSGNASGWNYRGEVCRVCHAPHDKGRSAWMSWDGVDAGLLWNHTLSDTVLYPMYTSDSLRGEIAGNVVGKSKLCLSCHDGTVAINAFDGNQDKTANFTGIGTNVTVDGVFIKDYASGFEIGPGRSQAGNDFLMGNHPISVAYLGQDLVDGEATNPTMFFAASNPKIVDSSALTITNDRMAAAGIEDAEIPYGGGLWDPRGRTFGVFEPMTFAPTIDLVLEKGMVQCHSCHDVHDSPGVNSIDTRLNRAGQGMATNRGSDPSGLCLSCHAK